MSLNLFLIQLVLFTAGFLLIQAQRTPKGWLGIAVLLLATLGGTFAIVPEIAGYISGSVWSLLVLIPLLGSVQMTRLVSQEQYYRAHHLATLIRWLHPTDGFWHYPALLKGLALGQQGELDQAAALFAPYQTNRTAMGRTATVLLYRMSARWDELLTWSETQLPEPERWKEWLVASTYVRSLGEVGHLNQLLQAVIQMEQQFGRRGGGHALNQVRLYAFAFCGYTWQVRQLLEGPLSIYPEPTRQFWLATADMAAGHSARAQQQLIELRDRADAPLQNAIQWRLTHPLAPAAATLTPGARQLLAQMEQSSRQEARDRRRLFPLPKNSYATYTLIAANVAMFGVATLAGGSEDLYVLYRLGALIPELVFAGEWWRTVTATFLHFGMLHLIANMLGLYIFGGLVETALGPRKFLVCYGFSGIGSMLVVALMALQTQTLGQITVGASGAVMGAIGAEGAIQLKGWRQEKAKAARERLRLIGIVIGLQILSDLLTPQVSMVGHLAGLGLGFLAGTILFKTRSA